MSKTKKELQQKIDNYCKTFERLTEDNQKLRESNNKLSSDYVDLCGELEAEKKKNIKISESINRLEIQIDDMKNNYSFGYVTQEQHKELQDLLKDIYMGIDNDFKVSKLTYDKLTQLKFNGQL